MLSIVSTSGDRPPWTQRTAPPLLEGGRPLALGERGGEEALGSSKRRRLRGKRDVTSPREFMISISISSSMAERLAADSSSISNCALVPRTRAPRAR